MREKNSKLPKLTPRQKPRNRESLLLASAGRRPTAGTDLSFVWWKYFCFDHPVLEEILPCKSCVLVISNLSSPRWNSGTLLCPSSSRLQKEPLIVTKDSLWWCPHTLWWVMSKHCSMARNVTLEKFLWKVSQICHSPCPGMCQLGKQFPLFLYCPSSPHPPSPQGKDKGLRRGWGALTQQQKIRSKEVGKQARKMMT